MKDLIHEVRDDVIKIQSQLLQQIEGAEKNALRHTALLEKLALSLIDIIDLIELSEANMAEENSRIVMNKTKKRILKTLTTIEVHPLEPPKRVQSHEHVKVISTQKSTDFEPGDIITVVRKGYKSANKVLRPTEVISAV